MGKIADARDVEALECLALELRIHTATSCRSNVNAATAGQTVAALWLKPSRKRSGVELDVDLERR